MSPSSSSLSLSPSFPSPSPPPSPPLSLSFSLSLFLSFSPSLPLSLPLSQDVFTVSVGNLPPGASVLIKITYVAELVVEGDNIVFSLPGNVAPWKQDIALDQTTQKDLQTTKIKNQRYAQNLQTAKKMYLQI